MIVIDIIGLLLIVAVVYWFWLSQPKAKKASDKIIVAVEHGVYDPSVIEISAKQPLKLEFLRRDDSPCAEIVQFKDLDIGAELPLNKSYILDIPPLGSGVYEFTCQMGMYRGKLLVK
mgnify:FL=1